jgi:hypothetical protein
VSILELLGHRDRALNALGIGAALAETAAAARIDTGVDAGVHLPHDGRSRTMMRTAEVLSGPVPLLLRVFAGRSPTARKLAALSTVAGSIHAVRVRIEAGRASVESSAQAIATKSRRTDGGVT